MTEPDFAPLHTLPFAPARCLYVIVGDPSQDPEPETPFAHVSDRLIASTPVLRAIALLPIEIHELAVPDLYTRISPFLLPRHAIAYLRTDGLTTLYNELKRYPFVAFFVLNGVIPMTLSSPLVGHIVLTPRDKEPGRAIISYWREKAVDASRRVASTGWPQHLIETVRVSAERLQSIAAPFEPAQPVPPHRCLQPTAVLGNRARGYWAEDCYVQSDHYVDMADLSRIAAVQITQAEDIRKLPRALGRSATLIVPSFNPHYYSGVQSVVSGRGGPPELVSEIVNNHGYLQVFSVPDGPAEFPAQEIHRAVASIRRDEIDFHDATATLFSANHHLPVFRTPQVPGTLFQEMDRVANLKWTRTEIARSVRRWQALGEHLADAIGHHLIDWLADETDRVIAFSDLPVEWCMSDGVPLGYLTRVNRIPLSPGNMPIMPVVQRNPTAEWTSLEEVRILICDAHDQHDPLRVSVPVLQQSAEICGFKVDIARVESEASFVDAIEQNRPSLLIFSGHGNVIPTGAALAFPSAHSLLRIDDLRFAPDAAIICACRSDAVTKTYGSPASNLWSAGVKAVLGTYLKISEPHASLVVASILTYIASGINREQRIPTFGAAVARALHLRRPVDILVAAEHQCRKRGIDAGNIMILFEQYVREHNAGRVAREPRELWSAVESTLLELAAGTPYREAVETVIRNKLYRPESQFYTLIGDADSVLLGPQYPQHVRLAQ